jgi:hypothetical protein
MSLSGLPPVVIDAVAPLHAALRQHRVYGLVADRAALVRFMEGHVFAVWDFMSLLKRLQRDLTVVEVPWRPGRDPTMARLINEIVLAEESDVVDGRAISHFSLYCEAMREVGAATAGIDALVTRVARAAAAVSGATLEAAIDAAVEDIPHAAARAFVASTMHTVRQGSTLEVAASFLLGREDIIPTMFDRLRADLPTSPPPRAFLAYLDRHIRVDADEHGPAATRLLLRLIDGDVTRAGVVAEAATSACRARLALWDGLAADIESV